MRVISLNVNGLRSAVRKGLLPWLASIEPWDFLCLQEIKVHSSDLSPELRQLSGQLNVQGQIIDLNAHAPPQMYSFFSCAVQKGYSGVAIYTKHPPQRVIEGIGNAEFDNEGRYLQLDYPEFSIVSVYQPSGSSSPERQEAKFRFMAVFYEHLRQLRAQGREYLIVGDWNIAHHNIDLKNWRGNQKNSGFLPEERAWLSQVFDELGWVDVFRQLDQRPEQYTWWSNRGQAWAKNVGWRIDYQIATPGLAKTAQNTWIYKEQRFSDHAPLIIDYRYPLALPEEKTLGGS